ncbi:MAG: phosphatase PAP2 family protein [Oscillospiraceae bacterium]|nr:phosphatase PAP2 family protein [Oscillospiraceae bacterium]
MESIRNPVLDRIMGLVTYLGDELLFMVVALLIYWCRNKQEGYYLLFVGFFGTMVNQFLKILFRVPRPWVKDPRFTIVESAGAGASGYSFPSGHTQSAVGNFGAIARWETGWGKRLLCVGLILLVSFSRMYLGVHTPPDVGVSLLLGTVLVFVFYPIVRRAQEQPKVMAALIGFMLLCALGFVLYANCAQHPVANEEALENLNSARKNSFSLLGALLGFSIAYPVERKYIRFSEQGSFGTQCCKLILGLGGLLGVKEGLKVVFSACGWGGMWLHGLRYCAVVLFAALVWPLTFPLWNKLCKKRG